MLLVKYPMWLIAPIWKNCIVDGFRLCSFAENAEFVDDITTFRDLAGHLQSSGCHLVKLSAAELSVKHGVGGCFRSLLRQLLADVPDVSDMLNLLRCTISTTSQSVLMCPFAAILTTKGR